MNINYSTESTFVWFAIYFNAWHLNAFEHLWSNSPDLDNTSLTALLSLMKTLDPALAYLLQLVARSRYQIYNVVNSGPLWNPDTRTLSLRSWIHVYIYIIYDFCWHVKTNTQYMFPQIFNNMQNLDVYTASHFLLPTLAAWATPCPLLGTRFIHLSCCTGGISSASFARFRLKGQPRDDRT